jgi:DNA-binding CsgD family transcriptional regulator
MDSSQLREGDVDLMLRVIADGRNDDPGEKMPWALLDGLQALIACDLGVSYQHHDYVNCYSLVMQGVTDEGLHEGPDYADYPDPAGSDDAFWQLWWSSKCSYPQRAGDLVSVIHTGDFFPTERDRLADPLSEVLDDLKYTMIVSLPAPPGQARRVMFQRWSGPSFSERDRQVAALLRPHFEETWLDAERRRHGVPQLTPREWQVLGMAAAGLSYAQIAHELFVSVGTVRKHMEHVRDRLGVHSLGEAAALALPHAPAAMRVGVPAPGRSVGRP